MNVYKGKMETFKQVYNAYLDYYGYSCSDLENEVEKIRDKITSEEYRKITNAIDDYRNYIFNILAASKKIKFHIDKNIIDSIENDDINKIFDCIEENV